MKKTYEEINEKIKRRKAVVVTAEEIIDIVKKDGYKSAAKKVDVVTTGTFGPMCSSGAFLNVGHTKPRIKIQHATLNGVPAYSGIAAVDLYIGATELHEKDPANKIFPGRFKYGGGHVIEDLVANREVELIGSSYGTDCYPNREVRTMFRLKDINEALLTNPRNAYQNYNVAVNLTVSRPLYTYMGVLRPNLGNANYCSAGQLSPLLNDPLYKTIGPGTRIFLGGGVGHVFWNGTQHNPCVKRQKNGVPLTPAGTLAVCGDLKQMTPEYLKGVSFIGYGVTMAVGIGVPIPVLDERVLKYCAVSDKDLTAPVVDYSVSYPNCKPEIIRSVSYAELRSGSIELLGKNVQTASLSSYAKARQIAETLKQWVSKGKFLLGKPIENLPGPNSGIVFKPLPIKNKG